MDPKALDKYVTFTLEKDGLRYTVSVYTLPLLLRCFCHSGYSFNDTHLTLINTTNIAYH